MLYRLIFCAISLIAFARPLYAAPPTPDHIVIVIEENKSFDQVIGSASAPYINLLAESGMLFTNFYAITHPSQPNYLEFFSGSNQGVTTNSTPTGLPFTTPNLGAELIAAGHTFGGYSQSMPSVGYTGDSFTTVPGQNQYVRKHNPWVNWQSNSPGTNLLPPAVNMPFTSFPSDFSTLPRVSIVVPDEQNDMHDGTIGQADAWLQSNLGAYATWAQTNNSLLVVTFDEDNSAAGNRIPTIFSGQGVQQGENASTWTLHNLLRTVEDMYGTTHAGSAADVRSIVGAFTTDPTTTIKTFQQGANGYAGVHDTFIESANAGAAHGGDVQLVADGSPLSQGLIKFDDLIGHSADQIPVGATIASAKLSLQTGSVSGDTSVDSFTLHQMLTAWNESSTWSSLNNGVSTDGTDAAANAEFRLIPNVATAPAIFDVTDTIEAWLADPSSNQGWVIKDASGTDGWRFASSEAAGQRPALEITFVNPFVLGDMNGDGVLNNFDIQPFEQALTDSATYLALYPALLNYEQRGNVDGNFAFNNFDIQPFEQLLTSNLAAVSVPEPGGVWLLSTGVFAVIFRRRILVGRRSAWPTLRTILAHEM